MSEGTYRTQRSTAARNRAAIMEAAHTLMTENPSASMNEVARRAGVGAGTLYRNFPTREDLILAVYQHEVERLVGYVDEVLATESTARQAFVAWYETLAAYVRVKHGLGEALHTAAAQELINATYAPVSAAVGKLMDACVAEGSMAPGHDPGDVIQLMGFLWRVGDDERGAAQGRRLIDIVFDGLRR